MSEPRKWISKVVGAGVLVCLVALAYVAVALGTSLRVPGARRVRHALIHYEPRHPPIVAYALTPYTGQLDKSQQYTAVELPSGMSLTEGNRLEWTPTHEDAPYATVRLETSGGERVDLRIHVVGVPKRVRENIAQIHSGFSGAAHSYLAIGDSTCHSPKWMLELAEEPEQALAPPWNKASGFVFCPRGFDYGSGVVWNSFRPLGQSEGGQTASPSILEAALRTAQPEFCTVTFGLYDGGQGIPPEAYKANLQAILGAVTSHGCIPVLCAPSRNGLPWIDMPPYIDVCREVAEKERIPLLDLDMLLENEDTLNAFWEVGDPSPSFDMSLLGEAMDDYDTRTGYGAINRGLYYMHRYLIELGILDAPAAVASAWEAAARAGPTAR